MDLASVTDSLQTISQSALSAADDLIDKQVPAVLALDRNGRILRAMGPIESFLESGEAVTGARITDLTRNSLRLCIVGLLNSAWLAIDTGRQTAREEQVIWTDTAGARVAITLNIKVVRASSESAQSIEPIILLTIARQNHLYSANCDEADAYLHSLETLLNVKGSHAPDFSQSIRQIMAVGLEFTGLEFGLLARAQEGRLVVENLAGEFHPRFITNMGFSGPDFIRRCLDDERPVVADHAWKDYPGPQQVWHETRAYIAAPINLRGESYGTLYLFSNTPRAEPFSRMKLDLVVTLAGWLSDKIEQQKQLDFQKQRADELQLELDAIPDRGWEKNHEGSVVRKDKAAQITEPGSGMYSESCQPGDQERSIVSPDAIGQTEQDDQIYDLNAELAHLRSLIRDQMRNAPAMMHSTGPNFNILEVSELWLERLGYSRDEVIGKKTIDFLTEESKCYARDVIMPTIPAMEDGGIWHQIPYQFICKDGSLVDIELSANRRHGGLDGKMQTIIVLNDVTERNKALREIADRNHELETANASLQSFAYIASHDLQEPLRKISLFSEMLSKEYQAKLQGNGTYYLEVLTGSAIRMKRLISDLLSYSRLSNQPCKLEPVDLNAVVSAVVAESDLAIDESSASVVFEVLPTFNADGVLLEQLMRNLISNAIKYRKMDHEPVIEIKAERDEVDNTLELTVSDNGTGFDPEQAERIFEPFVRLQSRNRQSGSGIGLAICRTVAERHGWRIAAESTPGKGSVFRIQIPADRA